MLQAVIGAMSQEALMSAAQSPSSLADRCGVPVTDAVTAIRTELDFRKRNPRFRRR